eukprot:3310703-Alexandrium_andersonii.AAC.1
MRWRCRRGARSHTIPGKPSWKIVPESSGELARARACSVVRVLVLQCTFAAFVHLRVFGSTLAQTRKNNIKSGCEGARLHRAGRCGWGSEQNRAGMMQNRSNFEDTTLFFVLQNRKPTGTQHEFAPPTG